LLRSLVDKLAVRHFINVLALRYAVSVVSCGNDLQLPAHVGYCVIN